MYALYKMCPWMGFEEWWHIVLNGEIGCVDAVCMLRYTSKNNIRPITKKEQERLSKRTILH